MERVRPEDGTKVHRSCMSFHAGASRRGKAPLHAALRSEAEARYTALVACERAVEDAEDARQRTHADVVAAEADFENMVRDIDAELGKLDRADASLNARRSVFPNGFGEVVGPEGEDQLDVLPGLRKRLQPFQALPSVVPLVTQLDTAAADLRTAVDDDKLARAAIEAAKLNEEAAKQAVREQLEAAYGQLRSHYKARPALAERFFLRNPRGRKKASAKAKVVTKSG